MNVQSWESSRGCPADAFATAASLIVVCRVSEWLFYWRQDVVKVVEISTLICSAASIYRLICDKNLFLRRKSVLISHFALWIFLSLCPCAPAAVHLSGTPTHSPEAQFY